MEDAMADEIRSRPFRVVRRGYEREAVERFRAESAERIAALERRVAELEGTLRQLGFEDPVDLAAELARVGEDVARILEQARVTAEELRGRAAEDARRWREEAETAAQRLREEAAEASRALRGAAWEEGSALLAAAVAEADRLRTEAREEAMLVRAEAEQEALRLGADARRDRDEMVGSAREEADRILGVARAESETILASARRQAEAAQERALALEARRAELMAELESARASIGALEDEIATRRQQLEAATPSEPEEEDERSHWPADAGGVRIVPAERVVSLEPVDAEAIAAEVQALREGRTAPPPVQSAPTLTAPAVEAPPPVESAPSAEAPPPTVGTAGPQTPPEAAATSPVEAAPSAEAPPVEPSPPVEAPPRPTTTVVPDDLDALFAALRGETAAEEPATDAEHAASSDAAPAGAPAAPVSPDPLLVRDRRLLPLQNRALRAVKKGLLEAQNGLLEEIRIGDGGRLEPEAAAAIFSAELETLDAAAYAAGFGAAAELAGGSGGEVPARVFDFAVAARVAEDLAGAVAEVLAAARERDAGARELGAAASRVFRAWRTDEAERRIRFVAASAYHAGLLAALAATGSDAVVIPGPGRICLECPAGKSPWDAAGDPPRGTTIPPAGPECGCTVAPGALVTTSPIESPR